MVQESIEDLAKSILQGRALPVLVRHPSTGAECAPPRAARETTPAACETAGSAFNTSDPAVNVSKSARKAWL
jgi:hypothetical protein